MTNQELENRLIRLSVSITNAMKDYEFSVNHHHLKLQILRSSSSAALNYGEAQGAESKKDFIHKISLVLKELKETSINLRIILNTVEPGEKVIFERLLKENDELNAIFYATLKTALKNSQKPK